MELFDLKEVELKKEEFKTCKTCDYRQRWGNYFTKRVTQRCALGKRKNGELPKIKVTNKACAGYKEAETTIITNNW